VLDGTLLFRVQGGEVRRGHCASGANRETPLASTPFEPCANESTEPSYSTQGVAVTNALRLGINMCPLGAGADVELAGRKGRTK
jgi:hypothetical protein